MAASPRRASRTASDVSMESPQRGQNARDSLIERLYGPVAFKTGVPTSVTALAFAAGPYSSTRPPLSGPETDRPDVREWADAQHFTRIEARMLLPQGATNGSE